MEFRSSKTRTNLINAFAGESQARNRYSFFASEAKKSGYEQISSIFTDTADNEKEHAKMFYKLILEHGGQDMITVTESYPVVLGDTLVNLASAIAGEKEEWEKAYPEMAQLAQQEGFPKIAAIFRQVAEAEKSHAQRFTRLKANIETGKVFKRDKKVSWRCRNCGRVIESEQAPQSCPTCQHPQSYFEIQADNY